MDFADILTSCKAVLAQAKHVSIDNEQLETEISHSDAKNLYSVQKLPSDWAQDYHLAYNNRNEEIVCQYIFLLDAMNFCFWPVEGYEYSDLAGSIKRVVEKSPNALDADNLARVSSEQLKEWLFGDKWTIQENFRLDERSRLVRQLGKILKERFNGLAVNVVKAANKSAAKLVDLITSNFSGFRDHTVYQGFQVFFYKRAQILVGDLWGAFEGKGLGEFADIHMLTCFADYRIPQLLRHLKILNYSSHLSEKVDQKDEIISGSLEEIEIRAATVIAVEEIKQRVLKKYGNQLISVQLDWLLWERGEAMIENMNPHHRCLTIFY
jgi:hypothetical protein